MTDDTVSLETVLCKLKIVLLKLRYKLLEDGKNSQT